MIYTIERRSTFGEGSMESHYEVSDMSAERKLVYWWAGKLFSFARQRKKQKNFAEKITSITLTQSRSDESLKIKTKRREASPINLSPPMRGKGVFYEV